MYKSEYFMVLFSLLWYLYILLYYATAEWISKSRRGFCVFSIKETLETISTKILLKERASYEKAKIQEIDMIMLQKWEV